MAQALQFIQPDDNSPGIVKKEKSRVDLDKLAHAVAHAESGDCKSKLSKKTNNCHSIMTWATGTRQLKKFASKEQSYAAFKSLWARGYKVYPTLSAAKKYTGGDKAKEWLAIVNLFYNQTKI